MKLKRFRNKFISMLLTLAMLLTLFPTAVFAEDTAADRPASAEFKIMGLYALRDNGRRVSFFSYESRDNAFLTKSQYDLSRLLVQADLCDREITAGHAGTV